MAGNAPKARELPPLDSAEPWILAFECSGAVWSVALACGDRIVATHQGPNAREASEHLVCVVRDMLTAHAVPPNRLTALGVGTGPGSFTGTRVALATAFGMHAGLPLLTLTGVDAFTVERARFSAPSSQASVVTAIFSPPDDVYLSVMQGADCTQSFACRVDAVASRIGILRAHAAESSLQMQLIGTAWALPALAAAAAGTGDSILEAIATPPSAAAVIAQIALRAMQSERCADVQVCAPGALSGLLPKYVGEPRISVPTPRSFAARPVPAKAPK